MNAWDFIAALGLVVMGISASLALGLKPDWRRRYGRKPGQCGSAGLPQDCMPLWPDSWLAIKSRNVALVQAALSLHNPKPCSWVEGLTNADKLFIAPPVKGWILVTGPGLPWPSEDVDACFRFVLDLSRKLGEVQLFTASRTVHHHAWVKAQNGRVARAYAWAGVTVWQQGFPTRCEAELGLKCFDYTEPTPGVTFESQEAIETNTRKVALLAARWGLDPGSIQQRFPLNEQGVSGKPPAQRY